VTVPYGDTIDLRALLMTGMMIGILGVHDDVTLDQTATVEQIRDTKALLAAALVAGRGKRARYNLESPALTSPGDPS
jgi:hypothetical protein